MNQRRRHPQDWGFTLIEMLVAMALIGLGLLGIAALQLEAARANQDAFQRTQVTLALIDLGERVRMAHSAFAADSSQSLDDQALVDDWQAELDRLLVSAGPTKLNASLDCSGGGDCYNQDCRILIQWQGPESETRKPDALQLCLGMP